jgi:Na+/H+ antiporter NhaC
METRPYFLLGDLASSILSGVVVGLVCAAVIDESWNPTLAMIVGMTVSMLVVFPLQLGCNILFGAFEVMLPTMLTSMAAGMVVPMAAAERAVPWKEAAFQGGVIGLAVLVFTYVANAILRGEVRRWKQ